MRRRPLAERFWEKVDKRAPYECWPWKATKNPCGYGMIRLYQGRMQLASRVVYELTYGTIPELPGVDAHGTCVLHRCDNPACVNPSHLFLVTHADNGRDMAMKGRVKCPQGEDSPQAKLTAAQVIEIRRSAESGAALGRTYGVTKELIYAIRKRKIWKLLPDKENAACLV